MIGSYFSTSINLNHLTYIFVYEPVPHVLRALYNKLAVFYNLILSVELVWEIIFYARSVGRIFKYGKEYAIYSAVSEFIQAPEASTVLFTSGVWE